MLAIELYRLIKEVEDLEKELKELPSPAPGRQEIEDRLRSARAERDRVRAMVEGAKDD
jgi:hypothetical protein